MFERLHQLGHRIIGYLDHTHDVHHREKFGYAWLVQRGFERAQKDFKPVVVIEPTTDTIQSTYAATCALLRREPRLTAIVTIRRIMPIGALRALRDHGRCVPDDCTVVGITTSTLAQYSTPQLTSADLPLNDMVRTGAELVLRQLAGDRQPRQVIFPAHIVDRETAAPHSGTR